MGIFLPLSDRDDAAAAPASNICRSSRPGRGRLKNDETSAHPYSENSTALVHSSVGITCYKAARRDLCKYDVNSVQRILIAQLRTFGFDQNTENIRLTINGHFG